MKTYRRFPTPPSAGEAWAWARSVATVNVGYKLLSLFLATAIWGWVQSREVVDEALWVDVNYITAPELVIAAPVPRRIKVVVSGPRASIKKLRDVDLETTMDLTEQAEGISSVEFEPQKIPRLPDQVDVMTLKPNQVQVELARKMMRQLTLKPSYSGQLPRGYRIASISLEPPFIDVQGPASALKALNEIIIDSISVDDLTHSVPKIPVSVRLPPNVMRVDESPLYASIEVEPLFTERRFDDVVVHVQSDGWEVAPLRLAEVMVIGPPPVLDDMTVNDNLFVRVVIDADAPREPTEARWGNKSGARIVVLIVGDATTEGVTVKSIEPESVHLTPTDPEAEEEAP